MNRYSPNESFVGSLLRTVPLLIATILFAIYYVLCSGKETSLRPSNISLHPSQNRTLGFGDILVAVVPSSTAEHFHHQLNTLSLASHYSEIDIKTFEGGGDKKYSKVWRGHMTMLRYVLEHNLDTALILEGTVDWDVRIKDQLELLSANLPGATVNQPYGVNWMALWLGRCGARAEDYTEPRILFEDATIGAESEQHETSSDARSNQRSVRAIQKSGCTVAYAVTQSGAKRILDEIGFEHVNLALDREEVKSYNVPGLAIIPALFEKWDPDCTQPSATLEYRLERSIRKALYNHD